MGKREGERDIPEQKEKREILEQKEREREREYGKERGR